MTSTRTMPSPALTATNGPSVTVRGKPTVISTVQAPGRRLLYVRGHRNTPTYSDT